MLPVDLFHAILFHDAIPLKVGVSDRFT